MPRSRRWTRPARGQAIAQTTAPGGFGPGQACLANSGRSRAAVTGSSSGARAFRRRRHEIGVASAQHEVHMQVVSTPAPAALPRLMPTLTPCA
jgi:hypothetical protein